ncbi:MAG: AMP-binding protein [Candidatus Competibacteraceae bacterium]|nr:AMP-binding protein [Candidatus Competibacteraceae bacterium]
MLEARRKLPDFPDVAPDTSAVILYTSGTTGEPKGTLLSHGQLDAHTAAHAQWMNYHGGDKTLVCLKLSSNFAFSHQMLTAIWAGATQ